MPFHPWQYIFSLSRSSWLSIGGQPERVLRRSNTIHFEIPEGKSSNGSADGQPKSAIERRLMQKPTTISNSPYRWTRETITTRPRREPVPGLAPTDAVRKMAEARKYIVHELLSTENNYVRNLQQVLEKYRDPLIRAATTLDGTFRTSPSLDPSVNRRSARAGSSGSDRTLTSKSRVMSSPMAAQMLCSATIVPMIAIKIMFAFIEELWRFNRRFSVELDEVVHNWVCSEAVWESRHSGTQLPDEASNYEPLSIGKLFLSHVSAGMCA